MLVLAGPFENSWSNPLILWVRKRRPRMEKGFSQSHASNSCHTMMRNTPCSPPLSVTSFIQLLTQRTFFGHQLCARSCVKPGLNRYEFKLVLVCKGPSLYFLLVARHPWWRWWWRKIMTANVYEILTLCQALFYLLFMCWCIASSQQACDVLVIGPLHC